MILEGYNFKIKYRPGSKMGHADALSRLSLENTTNKPWYTNDELEFVISLSEDEESLIKGWIKKENPLPQELKGLEKFKVTEENGIIFVDGRSYVPTHRIEEVATRLHEHPLGASHFGFKKTYENFCNYFFGLNAYSVIKKICENCEICPKVKSDNKTPRTNMGTVVTSQR